jgi:carbonic anhydrase
MWTHTKESQENMTPDMALTYLKEGNLRFLQSLKLSRNLLKQVNLTSEGQFPFAAVLSCIDSRTSAELIFDQGLGDIFSIRIAGNILNEDILGSIEYACKIAHSKLVLVLGHTKCGAVISACDALEIGHFTGLLRKLTPAIEMEKKLNSGLPVCDNRFINKVSARNVELTIQEIRKKSTILTELETKGEIAIAGGLYDIETGEVKFFED